MIVTGQSSIYGHGPRAGGCFPVEPASLVRGRGTTVHALSELLVSRVLFGALRSGAVVTLVTSRMKRLSFRQSQGCTLLSFVVAVDPSCTVKHLVV